MTTTSPPPVRLRADMPAVEGFGLVLASLATTIDDNREGTMARADPEFLHELRIAVRRSRTLLTEGKKVLPRASVDPAREHFRWLGDLTGPARDLDVYLLEWDRYTTPLGADVTDALAPMRALLEERRDTAHDHLDRELAVPATIQWMDTWRRSLAELSTAGSEGSHADRPLGWVVSKRIERAQQRLVVHGRAIGPGSPAAQVHALRKDAKKLRYLLECFGDICPERPRRRFVRRLKALQENLGEYQDAAVHVALVRELADDLHARGADVRTLLAMGRLTERLEQLASTTREEFDQRFAAYDTARTRANLDAVLQGIGP